LARGGRREDKIVGQASSLSGFRPEIADNWTGKMPVPLKIEVTTGFLLAIKFPLAENFENH
jgi:hypothetical protein